MIKESNHFESPNFGVHKCTLALGEGSLAMRQNWCLTSPKGTVGVERVWRQRVVFGDGDIVWRRGLCCESGQSHLGDEKVHFGV